MADYSFLNPEREIKLPVERLHRLALTQLIVTHEAIEFLRYEKMKIVTIVVLKLSLQDLIIWLAAGNMEIGKNLYLM